MKIKDKLTEFKFFSNNRVKRKGGYQKLEENSISYLLDLKNLY